MHQKSRLEPAWAAGFFDGEGTTNCVIMKGGHRSLSLTIGQVNRDNLFRFKVAVGEIGTVSRPYSKNHKRPISRFRAYGKDAHAVIIRLWPYLGEEKREQAFKALFAYVWRPVGHRGGLDRCVRGHIYAEVGRYIDPNGDKECLVCRQLRRSGPLSKPGMVYAIGRGLGVRQYVPLPLSA